MNQIQQKSATLEVLNLPTLKGIEDDNLRTLINNLIIEIYKYQAESERKRILKGSDKESQSLNVKGNIKEESPYLTVLSLTNGYNTPLTFSYLERLTRTFNELLVSIEKHSEGIGKNSALSVH